MSSTPQLEDGFTMLANELMERVLGFGFSHREQSVIFTIFRKTYGYGKKEDDMSASQIGAMCGISRQHVTTTLNLLALRNVITKRAGRYGSIIGIQKDHRKWITAVQMKSLPDSPESGQGIPQIVEPESELPLVPNQDTCPELGLVPNQDTPSPESGQVDSPESGHTKENLPKENHQKKTSCASQAKRDSEKGAAADRKDRATTSTTSGLQDRFTRFYAAYPKKKSRAAAEKAFAKLNPDEQLVTAMLASIDRAMTSGTWTDPKFIPHPATWLNAAGWLDEIQTEYSDDELVVIRLFNDTLASRLGEVPEAPFVESRAAAIRGFARFQEKPQLAERFFAWLRDEEIDLPPRVGFDWLLTREGFTKACAGNTGKSA